MQQKALKAIFKALGLPFKTQKEEKPYDPEFVAKIKRAEKQIAEGDYKIIETEDLWK